MDDKEDTLRIVSSNTDSKPNENLNTKDDESLKNMLPQPSSTEERSIFNENIAIQSVDNFDENITSTQIDGSECPSANNAIESEGKLDKSPTLSTEIDNCVDPQPRSSNPDEIEKIEEPISTTLSQDEPKLMDQSTPVPDILQHNQTSETPTNEDCETRNEATVCRDPLNILARSYEDTEPVYLSGIVDHITKSGEYRYENETRDNSDDGAVTDEGFSITNLMSNECINDIFDKIYVMNEKNQCCSKTESIEHFQSSSVHSNDTENEFTNSSSSSDGDSKPTFGNTNIKSSLKRLNNEPMCDTQPSKKPRRGITFDSVSVYYFPRTQGFTCIPSQGGSTLGMSWNHSHIRKFSLGEHAAEQRRTHKQYCLQQFSATKNWNEISNVSSEDSDSDEVISDSEIDYENYNFLQPIPTRERRAMLRASGIHKIDSGEKDECRSIRLSREFCGCTCQVYCDPDRCVCAQAGIKCQVDRMNFPCSCSRDGCANENGRIEFNPVRVRTHYIHTLMRLDMEKKKEEEEEQRSRLLMNNLENSTHLVYSSSPSSHLNINNNLMNFSYHANLHTYYQQQESGGTYSSSTSCFNFGGYPTASEQVSLGSNVNSQYHESVSRLAVANATTSTSMQYCGQLPSEQSKECTRLLHYSNADSSVVGMDQNVVIRDLTDNSKNDESQETYDADSLLQLSKENFESQLNGASQSETLDTSTEVSEETEKEESDTENFGDIIKKTMVESVIA